MSVKHRGAAPLHSGGAARILKGRHAGKIGYYDEDEGNRAVVYFGEPIHQGYVMIPNDHHVNVTSLEHEPSRRGDVRADESDPIGPPDHSAACGDPDAAAGEADQVDLLGMRADECELHDAEVEVDRQERLPAAMPATAVAAG